MNDNELFITMEELFKLSEVRNNFENDKNKIKANYRFTSEAEKCYNELSRTLKRLESYSCTKLQIDSFKKIIHAYDSLELNWVNCFDSPSYNQKNEAFINSFMKGIEQINREIDYLSVTIKDVMIYFVSMCPDTIKKYIVYIKNTDSYAINGKQIPDVFDLNSAYYALKFIIYEANLIIKLVNQESEDGTIKIVSNEDFNEYIDNIIKERKIPKNV